MFYRKPRRRSALLTFAVVLAASAAEVHGETGWPQLRRRLPPAGVEIPPDARTALAARAASLEAAIAQAQESGLARADLLPDVFIYLKAVNLALEHGEFWNLEEVDWAHALLDRGASRLALLRAGKAPWTSARGLVFRGFRSRLDDSYQPYGLVIPPGLDLTRPHPLYVYLHGRREKMAELQFLDRDHEVGRIEDPGAIVLHPFGRYCNGYKAAGEVDVLEAVAHVCGQYRVDPERVVLSGFSMGGAGVWHLAAHYPDVWVAASPGAGFAETRRYNRLLPEDFPPLYEQTLWHLYDAPSYVWNLFNMHVVAYSGENDRQIQAARVMEAAYQEHGRRLTHIIGPATGHRYHPDARREILAHLRRFAAAGLERFPERVTLQTRTLRYDRCRWVRIVELEEHWKDSRVLATRDGAGAVLQTLNVAALELTPPPAGPGLSTVETDDQLLKIPAAAEGKLVLERVEGIWRLRQPGATVPLRKSHGLQGPMDDAFLEPFLVVEPTGECSHPEVARWVKFELEHFVERWRRLFRGDVRRKKDRDVTSDDLRRYHLVLWGDPQSNALMARVLGRLPLRWTSTDVGVGGSTFDAERHVPLLIYPNPLARHRYVVFNTGVTFREDHDRTNSLQNPKLPDWAVLAVTSPPTTERAGEVVAAGFFDEYWQVK